MHINIDAAPFPVGKALGYCKSLYVRPNAMLFVIKNKQPEQKAILLSKISPMRLVPPGCLRRGRNVDASSPLACIAPNTMLVFPGR